MSDPVRQALEDLVRRHGESYSALSLMLGRNAAYIHQFMTRGAPRHLKEQDRRALARYFNVDESLLGGEGGTSLEGSDMVRVPRLVVRASAGAGSLVDGERAVGAHWFDKAWLRAVTRARPEELSIITVAGDSMAPTLNDGDELLVDRSDAMARLRDGIYILRRDDALMVKRLTLAPTSSTLTVSSDNPAYPTFHDCPLDSVVILGRVVWIGRKIG